LALDESKECDNTHSVDGFDFVVDKDLSEQLGNVFVDFKSYGFTINSEHELPGAGKDCSGCSCGK
jgi:hypothetical protein